MLKKLFLIATCSFLAFNGLSADHYPIDTEFEPPFNSLFVSDQWEFDGDDFDEENGYTYSFTHIDNDDVDFAFSSLPTLVTITLNDIEKQMRAFVEGRANSIPCLGLTEEMFESIPDEARDQLKNCKIERVDLGGFEWLRITTIRNMVHEYYESDKLVKIENKAIYDAVYFTIASDKIYSANLTSPAECRDQHEDFFDETVANLTHY